MFKNNYHHLNNAFFIRVLYMEKIIIFAKE